MPATTHFPPLPADPRHELTAAELCLCFFWALFSFSPLQFTPTCPPLDVSMHKSLRCVCWARNTLLSYSCSHCWNFKGRDQGDLLQLHSSEVILTISIVKNIILCYINRLVKNLLLRQINFQVKMAEQLTPCKYLGSYVTWVYHEKSTLNGQNC